MVEHASGTGSELVMPVGDLQGRVVWSESGERVGTIRAVNTDAEGRIISFDVRERWMLGAHHQVSAAGMRIDDGDVIVPTSAVDSMPKRTRQRQVDRVGEGRAGAMPLFLAGREGARGRFGGLDLIGSFFGALVAVAGLVLVGGLLAAAFGVGPLDVDTSLASLEALLDEAMLVGAAALFVSCFLGGWCAGRSARFDGVGNGLMVVVWLLAIGAAVAALGAWLGDEYDVFATTGLPSFTTDEFQFWGLVAFASALVLMLVGAALGGLLGESWHRRADRAMLDVVSLGDDPASTTGHDADTV